MSIYLQFKNIAHTVADWCCVKCSMYCSPKYYYVTADARQQDRVGYSLSFPEKKLTSHIDVVSDDNPRVEIAIQIAPIPEAEVFCINSQGLQVTSLIRNSSSAREGCEEIPMKDNTISRLWPHTHISLYHLINTQGLPNNRAIEGALWGISAACLMRKQVVGPWLRSLGLG